MDGLARPPVLRRRRLAALLAGAALLALLTAAAATAAAGPWATANGTVTSTRALAATTISSSTVGGLRVRWRFALNPRRGSGFGAITANPVLRGDTVYIQDSSSSVYALDVRTGRPRWQVTLAAPNDGPNGLSVVGSTLYAATDTTAFALDARTGRRLWSHLLVRPDEQFVGVTPVIDRGRVYVSTQGFPPGGRGALYALSARTGKTVWRFETIKEPWPTAQAGGGGLWYPVSVDESGNVYAGVANPGPWGGTKQRPNGAAFAGPALYTDSLIVLAGASGKLLWHDQVTRHDVRDYDFQTSPILATLGGRKLVFGAGKAGRVIAWDRVTHARVWAQAVGTHAHDLGPLPPTPTRVCPGLLGGVETPMAFAAGRLFVPVVELCMDESAVTSPSAFKRSPVEAKGAVYALDAATGRIAWQRRLGSAAFACATVARDVVFVPTYDGTVEAFSTADGRTLWRTRLRAGSNACPAVGSDLLVVAAGAPHPAFPQPLAEVIAFETYR